MMNECKHLQCLHTNLIVVTFERSDFHVINLMPLPESSIGSAVEIKVYPVFDMLVFVVNTTPFSNSDW